MERNDDSRLSPGGEPEGGLETLTCEAEAILRAILETTSDGVLTVDTEGRILSFNPAAEKIFGYRAAEVVGRPVSLLVPPPVNQSHRVHLENFLRTGRSRIVGRGREVTGRRKSGETFPLFLVVCEVQFAERRLFTAIARDLTEYKRLQDQMSQSQQLAAIGEMAASVAHEIKNPLAGISGAIEILRDTLPDDDDRRQIMDEILSEVLRLDNTVRDLLAFSRPWNPDLQWCNLRELTERAATAFQEQEEAWNLSYRFQGPAEVIARVDPWLFEKVLWNLLSNARDAMSGDGGMIQFHFQERPGWVELTVSDQGKGIPSELLNNVFRPFFTTKNRGTGLGLAICKKIMDAHNGSIMLQSREGEGTTVILRWPVPRQGSGTSGTSETP